MASLLNTGVPPWMSSRLSTDAELSVPAQLCSNRGSSTCAMASSKCRLSPAAFKKRSGSKGLPSGAYEMEDDASGDSVLVLGVEGRDLSDEELRWNVLEPGLGNMEAGTIADPFENDTSDSSETEIKNLQSMQKNKASATISSSSKGLFSRLKVQNLRSQKKGVAGSAMGMDARKISTLHREKDGGSWLASRDGKTLEVLSSRKTNAPHNLDEEDGLLPTQRVLEDLLKFGSKRDTSSHKGSRDDYFDGKGLMQKVRTRGLLSKDEKNTKTSRKATDMKNVVSEDFFSIRSFTDIGADGRIIQSLASMGVRKPSQIQAMSYQHIVEGRSCIVADQTGSGKTLAYLAPLFHRILLEEETSSRKSSPNRPRVLVLVPTTELAAQVLGVCRSLSKGGASLKSMVATGGFKLKTQLEALEDGPDIVIATPGRFLQLLMLESLVLDNVVSVILDEVDILFDDPEFSEALKKIENLVTLTTQCIHVTATLPVDVCNALLEKHPSSIPVMGPGLHCTATGLQEVLVDCSGDGEKSPEAAYENKKIALLQLIEQQPVPKTLVFCNKIETCRKVENALKRFDRKGSKIFVLPYHAALSVEARLESMQQFLRSDMDKIMVLVCTDRASRGLDLVDVEHVVLFDFPRDPSEYVRRVGRTARAGGAGKAFVFVVGKQVSLARKIMVRNEKGHPIHTVPSHSY